ncbi:MAG TPA: hypothetical protein VJ301_07190 [Propionibacteriaceae bacterium]|nr:hypothetical protein [Propionibacteriaceae bacterium]
MAAGVGVVAGADDVSWVGDGVLPADGLLEHPATASISAAAKNNHLILNPRAPHIGSAYAARPANQISPIKIS